MVSKPNKFLETPLVSIIVPTFNQEAFLAQCLQSVCGQTYRDLEIIVVDDNSSDSTGSILDSVGGRPAGRRASGSPTTRCPTTNGENLATHLTEGAAPLGHGYSRPND
jgi:cellulose synthase/poly-beta-1,6-N-acetylglucosamine synthase-like glycosyltransferase